MPLFTQTITDSVTLAERPTLSLPYAAVTDSVRTSASALLRLLRRPVRYVTVKLGPQYGFVRPGATIYCDHELLPEITRNAMSWRYVPLYVVEVNDPLSSPVIEVKCIDLREYYCSAWSPLRTDVGMTADLNGIAFIDRAGGWATDRNQLAYGERPAGDTSVDETQLFQEVLANSPVVSRYGLQTEGGGDTNLLLNSTFSEGAGNTFTSWTVTLSGAAVGVSWTLYTLIDAAGFRRSIQLATFNAGENAYVSQTAAGVGGKRLFVRIHYRDGGAIDSTVWRLQRSSDSKWFRDSDSSWQVATTDNALAHTGQPVFGMFFASSMIDLSAVGATDVTLYVGFFAATPIFEQITQLNAVEITSSPRADSSTFMRYRSPLPTKGATVTRVPNQTYFVNDSSVRISSPTRGFIKLTFRPNWSNSDLSDGDVKYLWARDTLSSALWYQRSNSTRAFWHFENAAAQSTQIDSDDVSSFAVAQRGQEYTIICRWTSNTQNEYDLVGQAMQIWLLTPDGTWSTGTAQVGATVDTIAATSRFYLGRSTNGDADGNFYADGHIFNFTSGDHVPTENELKRM